MLAAAAGGPAPDERASCSPTGTRTTRAGAARLAELSGAPVQAADPAGRLGAEGLADGDVITAAGCELRVVATPGHSADSVSLLLPADGALFTGDTVLGRGTTVIARDGNLGDYLRSLDQLRALAEAAELRLLLPGHGPMLADPIGILDYYLAHRAERLDQVRSALAAGAKTPAEIVAMIYTDVDRSALAGRRVVGPGPAGLPLRRRTMPAAEIPRSVYAGAPARAARCPGSAPSSRRSAASRAPRSRPGPC